MVKTFNAMEMIPLWYIESEIFLVIIRSITILAVNQYAGNWAAVEYPYTVLHFKAEYRLKTCQNNGKR